MVLARTLDCVRGVRLGAKDRMFAELEDEEEAMGARWGRQVGGTVGGESHQVREAFGSATTDACVLCGVLGFPPDADGNGNYAFFDAANYALIQMTGGVTAISAV